MSAETLGPPVIALLPVVLFVLTRRFLRRARAAGTAPRPLALLAGNALVLALLLSVALLAAECLLRFAYDGTDTFGILRTSDRWFERHFVRNREGFRDDVEYDLGPPVPGRPRIAFVGDSFTTGHGVPDVERRFVNIVRSRRPGWEVQMLAQNGADTDEEIDLLARRLPAYTGGRYRADVIVLVTCLNDICDIDPAISSLGRELAEAHDRGPLRRASYALDTVWFLSLLARRDDVRGFFPRLAALYAGPVFQQQRVRLRELEAAARALTGENGRVCAVTFPMVNRLGEGRYPLARAHTALAAFWRDEHVPHLDLLPALRRAGTEDLTVGALDAHPNERAHALAAEALLPFLDGLASGR